MLTLIICFCILTQFSNGHNRYQKCRVLYIGKYNPQFSYSIGGPQLVKAVCCRNLGVFISSDLLWPHHITYVAKKASAVLFLLNKIFCKIRPTVFVKLCKTLVRPILEFPNCLDSCPAARRFAVAINTAQSKQNIIRQNTLSLSRNSLATEVAQFSSETHKIYPNHYLPSTDQAIVSYSSSIYYIRVLIPTKARAGMDLNYLKRLFLQHSAVLYQQYDFSILEFVT